MITAAFPTKEAASFLSGAYQDFADVSQLDFTQNLKRATDALALSRHHSWLASDGFSLSAADPDIQELPVFCIIHS